MTTQQGETARDNPTQTRARMDTDTHTHARVHHPSVDLPLNAHAPVTVEIYVVVLHTLGYVEDVNGGWHDPSYVLQIRTI